MRREQSPYPARWWGSGLEIPEGVTYARLRFDDLPALPFQLRGDFGWLADGRSFDGHIGVESRAENEVALPRLLMAAQRARLTLPPPFVSFCGDSRLQAKVRSNTDCRLDLSSSLLR